MATFHVARRLGLNIIVDNLGTTSVFEHCLYVMFVFQPSSLHISKDVSYGSNKFVVLDSYDLFSRETLVVGNGCYHIVGDSLTHNSQATTLMLGMTCYVVKVVK
jgi:hypothetical protein